MSGMPPEMPAPAPLAPIPWEQPGYPFLKGFFETIGLFFAKPGEAFRRMPTTPSVGRPIVYYLVLGWIAAAVAQIYSLAFRSMMPMPEQIQAILDKFGVAPTPLGTVVAIVFAPIGLVIGLFLWTAIVHFFLFVLGGTSAGFLTTCRVVCYAGTVNLVNLVPFCGRFVAIIWGLVLQVIGLKEAHKTTTGKAVLAVLIPILLCCTCLAICVALAWTTIQSFLGSH